MPWDTMVGVSRRAWARNENALGTIERYNEMYAETDHITVPQVADRDMIREVLGE